MSEPLYVMLNERRRTEVPAIWIEPLNSGRDATSMIQSAITSSVGIRSVIIMPGAYTIGRVNIMGNLHVFAYGASFTLVGNQAGIAMEGTITEASWSGGYFLGDGTNRDSATATAQIAILIGNEAGANIQNVLLDSIRSENTNIGFKAAYGITPDQKLKNIRFRSLNSVGAVGTVGGVGYGFQMAQCDDSSIIDCFSDKSQRHGIYVSEGRNYRVAGGSINRNRYGLATGTVRGGLAISRSRNVTAEGITFDDNNDTAVVVDVDAQGLSPDNVLDGVTLRGLVFKDSDLEDIRIGTTNPATDGVPKNIAITNCTHVTKSGNTDSPVVVNAASRLQYRGNVIDASAGGASIRAVSLSAYGGAAYSTDIDISDNEINSAGYGVQIESALATGTSRLRVENRGTAASGMVEIIGGTISNANIAPWIGGVYADATRPAASAVPKGSMIFNTDDLAPNFSDGTDWLDAGGAVT